MRTSVPIFHMFRTWFSQWSRYGDSTLRLWKTQDMGVSGSWLRKDTFTLVRSEHQSSVEESLDWQPCKRSDVPYRRTSLEKNAATCPHVLPERLLHKRLPRGAQPFRRHHQRSTGLREWSKCVSFEAPKWMCRVLCKEDLPELQKVMLASVMSIRSLTNTAMCSEAHSFPERSISGVAEAGAGSLPKNHSQTKRYWLVGERFLC